MQKKNKIYLFVFGLIILFFASVYTSLFVTVILGLILLAYHRAYEVVFFSIYVDMILIDGSSYYFGIFSLFSVILLFAFDMFRKRLF